MEPMALPIRHWPGNGPWLFTDENLLVAAVNSEKTPNRESARRLVRRALCSLLGEYLACPAQDIRLISTPGQPIRLDQAGTKIGLSISHEPGLSLIAINPAGPVGIDLIRLTSITALGDEIPRLTQDYLGPKIAAQLAALPLNERASGFADAWTRLEAGLKCLNKGLAEWSPAVQRDLSACPSLRLQLPAGYLGSLALPAPKNASRSV